ncbi:uncharacterized protein LOC143037151 [Oratosquilla oratoria]|uniref:uncharacterized protein LOC143037151 n=1 Tax=Oratosquilla oratoria TaxID=337810 RepID=UPI003F75CC4D
MFLRSFAFRRIPPGTSQQELVSVLTFQPEGNTGEVAYGFVEKVLPPFTSMTTCLRFLPLFFRNNNAVLRLHQQTKSQMHLEFGIQLLINSLNGIYKFTRLPQRLLSSYWYLWCLVYDHSNNNFTVFLDGKIVDTYMNVIEGEIACNKVLVGQSIVTKTSNGLSGKLTQVNIWSRILTLKEMNSIKDCNVNLQGDVLSWKDIELNLTNAEETQIELASLCHNSLKEKSFFQFTPLTFAESTYLCEGLGGYLPLPMTQKSIEDHLGYIKDYEDVCFGSKFWGSASDDSKEGKWIVHTTGQTEDNLPWAKHEPNGISFENCILIDDVGYHDFGCKRDLCSLCTFDLTPSWEMLGSCEWNEENQYFSSFQMEFGNFYFEGYSDYEIKLVNDTWTWLLAKAKTVVARLVRFPDAYNYPMGRKTWAIENTMCGQQGGRRELLLTSCPEGSFTCTDGTCINILQRCDLKYDCRDKSDEKKCFIVQFPEDYATDLPPRPTDATTEREAGNSGPLRVEMDLVLERIDIDTTSMLMDSTFNLTFTWYDNRIDFRNLKEASYLNQLSEMEEQRIWSPNVTFKNSIGRKRSIKDVETYMTVLRYALSKKRNPDLAEEELPDCLNLYSLRPFGPLRIRQASELCRLPIWYEDTILESTIAGSVHPGTAMTNISSAAELYEGAFNPIVMSRVYSAVITCDFDLVLYPFDVQVSGPSNIKNPAHCRTNNSLSQIVDKIIHQNYYVVTSIVSPHQSVGDIRAVFLNGHRQHCAMNLEMLSTTASYLVFANQSQVSYTGSELLIEYQVGMPRLYGIELGAYSNIVAEVPFARRLGYALLNIYTPSLILLIIAYSTLFFRLDIFEVRIMTALTSLLVMATLFSQVSDSLPKTSYFKMVDVWLLFCIISTFLVIIFHIIIDLIYFKSVSSSSSTTSGGPMYVAAAGEKRPVPIFAHPQRKRFLDDGGSSISFFHTHQRRRHRAEGRRSFGDKLQFIKNLSYNHLVTASRVFLIFVFTTFNLLYWGMVFLYRDPM